MSMTCNECPNVGHLYAAYTGCSARSYTVTLKYTTPDFHLKERTPHPPTHLKRESKQQHKRKKRKGKKERHKKTKRRKQAFLIFSQNFCEYGFNPHQNDPPPPPPKKEKERQSRQVYLSLHGKKKTHVHLLFQLHLKLCRRRREKVFSKV